MGTRVVLLGTGTPNPTPDRSGPAAAVIAGGRAYIVDCGPGVVRRASAAALAGIGELEPERLDLVFITHLHSDHTAGYPDLILTPWTVGREGPLEAYGPPGLGAMTAHVLEAWSEDLAVRSRGKQPSTLHGKDVEVHEVLPGVVYDDGIVRVTAFAVDHGDWEHAYGYRFDAADRSIVFSGDTTATTAVVDACSGCDVLVHEVYALEGFRKRPPGWQAYHLVSHTSSEQLADIATKADPGLLVMTHILLWGATEEQLLEEVRAGWDGPLALGHDLGVY